MHPSDRGDAGDKLELVVFTAGDEPVMHALPAGGRVTIGRAPENDVRIDDPSVSRHHAVLHVGPASRIEDTGSANGTFVRKREEQADAETRKVLRRPGETFAVEFGDCIMIGSVFAVVRRARAAADAPGGLAQRAAGAGPVIVEDPTMRAVYEQARLAARAQISILLLGETGVGKEVLAREIHRASPRAQGPFLAIHCAALSESLLESELFGHEKGSFTGAAQARAGLFEAADGGTVLLDEIGELSPSVQVKLLRVLEERAVMRIGARSPRPVDVRFIAATNRDLEAEVARGAFREDLFYRLNGIALTVPPLRARAAEVVDLASLFLAEACKKLDRPRAPSLSPEARSALERYPWPGNVRELRNAMERVAVLCPGEVALPEHLPPRIAARAPQPPAFPPPPPPSPSAPGAPTLTIPASPRAEGPGEAALADRESAERQRIMDALDQCAGNQTRAAELLGISRRTLVSRLEEYGLPRPRKR
jgi:DNA-binding NtrC family response regulator